MIKFQAIFVLAEYSEHQNSIDLYNPIVIINCNKYYDNDINIAKAEILSIHILFIQASNFLRMLFWL